MKAVRAAVIEAGRNQHNAEQPEQHPNAGIHGPSPGPIPDQLCVSDENEQARVGYRPSSRASNGEEGLTRNFLG